MKATYSRIAANWAGFSPVAYSLGLKAFELPLKRTWRGEGESAPQDVTIGSLMRELQLGSRNFEVEDEISALLVKCDSRSAIITGASFNREVAKEVLKLEKEGIPAIGAFWFFFDKDVCATDPMERYQFFVVSQNQIVREEVSLVDTFDSGFDPTIFDSNDKETPIWFNHPRLDEAWAAFWYRKFYRETRMGQLMELRPDNPKLYYFPEGRPWSTRAPSASTLSLLWSVRFQLWIVIALLALIAYLLIRR